MSNTAKKVVPIKSDSTPSISASAMQVQLSIGQWRTIKKDVIASREVTTAKHAVRGTAVVNKDIMGGSKSKAAIGELAAAIYKWHRSVTLPWSNMGMRLLTNIAYPDYVRQASGFRQEFEALVQCLVDDYRTDITKEQVRLGDMFDASLYPSVDEVRHSYRLDITYIPIPEAGDFRVDIGNSMTDDLAEQYNKFYGDAVASAMKDVWKRLLEPLERMSMMLDYAGGDKPKGFKDTLVSNVEDIVSVLKMCNVTGDAQMESVRLALKATLSGITPDGLRASSTTRNTVKQKIDGIIKTLPELDW